MDRLVVYMFVAVGDGDYRFENALSVFLKMLFFPLDLARIKPKSMD